MQKLINGSPARGAIWVENNGAAVFPSPVGTQCGYPERHDTHIASLKGLWKLRKSPLATHISPPRGLKTFFGFALSSFFLLLLVCSCTPIPQNFQLQISLRNAQPGTLYLYRLSDNQAPALVDSFQNTQLDAQFTLTDQVPWTETLYQLSIPNLRSTLYFIADVASIQTSIDGVNPRAYTTTGSNGSLALQNLQHAQNPLQDSLTIVNNKINNEIGDESSLRASAVALRQQLMNNYFHFADTTTSPLAALFITQQLDFGNDRAEHKAFITRLEKRFKQHPQLGSFTQKTKDYLALFEVEYEIGDSLPSASFVDQKGQVHSPARWKGGYYLLEFWSSYCPSCLLQLEQKKAIYQKYHSTGFNMLAFSLDEDSEMLNAILQNQQYPWPVVADLKGWASQAVNVYKIDSIPFNILVGPSGKIIGKNADAKTLEGFLKRAK
ncbi:TlpA family protein disulfide reductase [Haliscomenobacter sp.]|uniref:TlpA family protein disulfide reductase n=1 Tax=Haliscomenobacter sp. TaxID=2717303 RepID=UPI0035941A38